MGAVKYLTMDELKRLSIPLEILKSFNHSIFPHKGHPTRSAQPPMNLHNIRHMNVGVVKYMTMDELKRLRIPSEMLKFFNHSSLSHMGHPTRSLHPPPPTNIYNIQCMKHDIIKCKDHGQIKAPNHPPRDV